MTEEQINIRPRKKWAVKEPTQWKFGCWYSCVMDPDTKELVYEILDFSKQMAFNTCVEWCRMNNKLAEEIENAKSAEMGSTLAPSSTNNI